MNFPPTAAFWPIWIAGALGILEGIGLARGWAWVYALRIPLTHYTETLPLEVTGAVPESTDEIPCVVALPDDRIAFMPRQLRLGTSASASGSSASAWGVTSYGVIRCERAAGSTTFRFEGCAALFPFVSLAGLLVSVCLMFRPLTAGFAALAITLFGGFTAAVVAWNHRKLLPAYHVLSADLAARAAAR